MFLVSNDLNVIFCFSYLRRHTLIILLVCLVKLDRHSHCELLSCGRKLNSPLVFHTQNWTECSSEYDRSYAMITVHRKCCCLRSHWNLIKLSQNCITHSISHSCSLSLSRVLHGLSLIHYIHAQLTHMFLFLLHIQKHPLHYLCSL